MDFFQRHPRIYMTLYPIVYDGLTLRQRTRAGSILDGCELPQFLLESLVLIEEFRIPLLTVTEFRGSPILRAPHIRIEFAHSNRTLVIRSYSFLISVTSCIF